MNCTKCGKEIPDGENTLCDECQAKLLKEISNENEKPSEEKVKKEKKEKTKKEKSKKEEKDSEFKVAGKSDDKGNNKIKLVAICAIVVVVLCLILLVCIKLFNTNKLGNTIGNIRNGGYGVTSGSWNYFLSPNEDTTKVAICRVKNNGKDRQELYVTDLDVVSINVYKNYVYFIGTSSTTYTEDDEIDNKIYRMKTDGSDLEVINDNEFNNECYEIYVLDNSVYYIGVDSNIYKMNLNGTNKVLVADNGTGFIGITEDYIVYNVTASNQEDDYVTYIMNIDGTNPRPILEGKRLYSIDIYNDYVYYTNSEKQIYKTKIDSGVEELVLDTTAYNLNLKDGYLYFLNYADAEASDYTVCLYRIKADGSQTEEELIKQLSKYSTYIICFDDWVMYMDMDNESGYINLVNNKGNGKENKVYELDYSEYYEGIQNDEEATPETSITEDGEVTEPEETVTNETSNEATSNTVQ